MVVVPQQISGKERVRGPNVSLFVKRANGIPMEEALKRSDEAGFVMASNQRLSKVLIETTEWQDVSKAFTSWSGTMSAYDKPGQELGETIEYADSKTGIRYVFPVPEEHRGKKNVVLVAEHPDFSLETDGKNRIVQTKNVAAVSGFPIASDKWYLCDPVHEIPTGDEVERDKEGARFLWRTDKWVGLVTRDYCNHWGGYLRRYIIFNTKPSETLGVIVEAIDAPKNDALGTAHEQATLISGISPEGLKALREASVGEVGGLLRTVKPEALEATRKLLEALRVVETKC